MSDEETQKDQDEVDIVNLPSQEQLTEKIKNFSDLLNDIENLNDKKKKLWREIYQNAIEDRQNSFAMFSRLVKIAESNSTEHAVHGKTMATYIEKMSKANDQLIKLAELIARAESKTEDVSPEDIYRRLGQK